MTSVFGFVEECLPVSRIGRAPTLDKKTLTEADIRTKFITPAIVGQNGSKWDVMTQLREEVYFTKGRVILQGKKISGRAGETRETGRRASRISPQVADPMRLARRQACQPSGQVAGTSSEPSGWHLVGADPSEYSLYSS